MIGKVQGSMLKLVQTNAPLSLLKYLTNRSIEWWVMSEYLPDLNNHVSLTSEGRIRIHWKLNNLAAHRQLLKRAHRMLQHAGSPITFSQQMGIETDSHLCGTLKMGKAPATSILDPYCRMHGLAKLRVVDASFFPSSRAMNLALTIAT